MKKSIRIFISVIVDLISAFILFWFTLPPLNPRSVDFWSYLFTVAIICVIVFAIPRIFSLRGTNIEDYMRLFRNRKPGKKRKIILCIIACIILAFVVASMTGAQLFNADAYGQLLVLEDGDFSQDVAELSMSQIPVVDKDTASRLGKRKLGEISDLVSQFEIEEDYTQINYHGTPVRVTPLAYGDIIKWFGNQEQGISSYIMVDMVTQETTLVQLEDGMKYSRSEYFMRNLDRYLRFRYPTKIFEAVTFEVDENGTPYWIASTVSYRIGVWGGEDIEGAVLLNAVTGECQYYNVEDVPQWVDTVYSSSMLIDQLTYNGKYRSGFLNSLFGQKGVLQPTSGYNYIAVNDDVYLYTGMTSVTSDESNVGFVLINMRTKDAKYYVMSGAEEYSAMESAQGQVQNLKYTATFPILLNVADRPTYFMSLKDNAGLVKMYAFVDMEQYQIVGTGNTIDEARTAYSQNLTNNGIEVQQVPDAPFEVTSVTGVVDKVEAAVVDGNTNYFVTLIDNEGVYILPVTLNDRLPFLQPGDSVSIAFSAEQITAVEIAVG